MFRLFFGLFRETKKHFYRFVSVFRTSNETTETNRTLLKQTETNQKISKKRSLDRKFFFSVRTETIRNLICFSCFSICFFAKQKSFWFVSMFRTGLETTETNRTYGMGNLKC
jgi:hypothetical protein